MMSLLTELVISKNAQLQICRAAGAWICFRDAGAKLFHAAAFFNLIVGEARLAFVAHASFGDVQMIVQILRLLAQRGDLPALLRNGSSHGFFCGFGHQRLFDRRFCESQQLILDLKQDSLFAQAQAIGGLGVVLDCERLPCRRRRR
jgi:hypothetical protein